MTRWKLWHSRSGEKWLVRRQGNSWYQEFPTWPRACAYLTGAISRWAITDLLDRAQEASNGELEAVPVALIQGRTIQAKRERLALAARKRELGVWIEEVIEHDPADSLFLLKVVYYICRSPLSIRTD